ncbi:U1 snRNP-associated protein [Sesamum angolense]|uniref:U1 snRNP-associated protein n=1 Tax=Sesamum angolense TaxID=2727404 RepID=A0AAE2BZG9_9LAMI|nr:U1 snRNP-associated protein [Sesamum angolense]
MDAQRALLDELMGSARNLTEEERRGFREIKWDDKEVCGCYMVRFCPHDLFVNTRSDLGVCPKIHDPKLKESFEKSPRHDSYVPKFKAELAHFCEKLVSDLDRRVRRGRERLAQEVEVPPPPPISAEKSEQLAVLEEKIKNLLEQVESLGEAGKVDEAEALMRKVEMLNIEKTALTQQPQQDKLLMVAQEKKMALCEICGSFLVANDAAERTQSHVTGKQHMGYGMVRDFLSEYKEAKEKAREEERLAREKEAEERRKLREKEYESRRRRSDSTDRDRYRDRDNDRERDRYRERDRDHERSRERNGRGSREGGRGSDRKNSSSSNGREGSRDRYRERDRSRSRSPLRHGRRSSMRLYHLPINNIIRGEKVEVVLFTILPVCFSSFWLGLFRVSGKSVSLLIALGLLGKSFLPDLYFILISTRFE